MRYTPYSAVPYDFTMCNPPFYASREEVIQSAEAKEFGPNAVRLLQYRIFTGVTADCFRRVCSS